jgi:hypothetical protein
MHICIQKYIYIYIYLHVNIDAYIDDILPSSRSWTPYAPPSASIRLDRLYKPDDDDAVYLLMIDIVYVCMYKMNEYICTYA